jgi:ADP-ribose pyrophosphatase
MAKMARMARMARMDKKTHMTRMTKSARPYDLEVLSDELIGLGGFLHVRRLHLRNLRPDGTRSAEWVCDFVERRKGIDAVVVALWRAAAEAPSGRVEVLVRDGLRPALYYGRPAERVPMPEDRERFLLTEAVAGIIEEGEVGEAAIRARAADEAWEEAGVRIDPADFIALGTSFPSPGMTAERFWFLAARVPPGGEAPLPGDGSPMEEGATTRWLPLDEAIRMCVAGEIEDAKTELILRRLRDRLDRAPA